jgi:hypothetical protein
MKWFGLVRDGEVRDYSVNIMKSSGQVELQGDTLVIRGSAKNDTISIVREVDRIVVNYNDEKTQYFFTTSNVIREVRVEGYSGEDSVTVTGLAGEEHYVLMNPHNASITVSDLLRINVFNVTNITYKGTNLDTVEMWDSKGEDTVEVGPNYGVMTGPENDPSVNKFVNKVEGVYQISVYSVRGGSDTLTLSGSSDGADQFISWMNSVTMSNVIGNVGVKPAYLNKASGFDTVIVTAQESAKLSATLYGSAGNDILTATYMQVNLSSSRTNGTPYKVQVNQFTNCVVDAGAGNDTATYTSINGGEHLKLLDDKKTVELFSNVNAMDDSLLKLIAFESLKFDAAKNRCTADIASINQALVEIDLIGDWVERNR